MPSSISESTKLAIERGFPPFSSSLELSSQFYYYFFFSAALTTFLFAFFAFFFSIGGAGAFIIIYFYFLSFDYFDLKTSLIESKKDVFLGAHFYNSFIYALSI